jgi:hypothetical protein
VLGATEKQAVEDMEKIKAFIAADLTYPEIKRNSDSLIEVSNGSRIVVVPATDKAARGYSKPAVIMLDECAYIEDVIYKSGIRPMLTDNPHCELILISTPNGCSGFFHASQQSTIGWTKYEIRAPFVLNDGELINAEPELEYRKKRAIQGFKAFYSPRHRSKEEQLEQLREIGSLMYRQTMLVEFLENEQQVFSEEEIAYMFRRGACAPLDTDSFAGAPSL